MSKTTTWTGNALAVAQVNTWAFAGTWEADDLIIITINGKSVTVAAGGVTGTLAATAAYTALIASTIPEFLEITWTNPSAGTVKGTAVTAGVPFTATFFSSEANGGNADSQTIEGVATGTLTGTGTTGTAATVCTGPNFADNALNWDNGIGVDTDTLIFANSSVDCLYGLGLSAVTPAAIYFYASYTGSIGLPLYHSTGSNPSSYLEYRPRYLQYCNSGDSTNTKIYVGTGPGTGSGRINLDTGSGQVTIQVQSTGNPVNGETRSFYWKGTHASNTISIIKGKVGIAYYPEELATIVSPVFAFVDQILSDVDVVLGSGVTITTGMSIFGGQILTSSNIGTVTGTGGILTVTEAATATLLNLDGLRVNWRSSGTITNVKAGSGGVIDNSENTIASTLTNGTFSNGSSLLDPFRNFTFTNPITLNRCGLADVTLNLGEHITLQRANGA